MTWHYFFLDQTWFSIQIVSQSNYKVQAIKTETDINKVLYEENYPNFYRSDGVGRLSISPSQGDDPGFKSRSEH